MTGTKTGVTKLDTVTGSRILLRTRVSEVFLTRCHNPCDKTGSFTKNEIIVDEKFYRLEFSLGVWSEQREITSEKELRLPERKETDV